MGQEKSIRYINPSMIQILKNLSVVMWLSTALVIFVSPNTNGFLHLNRTAVDFDPALTNVSADYTHDATANCVLNVTFLTFVTITNMRIYFKMNLAEDQFDRDFKKVLVSSVVEVEKVFKGKQSNIFINAIFGEIRRSMTFEYKLPLPPVRLDF